MLRVVLPAVAAIYAVAPIHAVAAVDVGIAIEIVIVVDRDVVITTPSAAPAPASAPGGPHRQSHAKGDRHACCVIAGRRVIDRRIRIDWGAVHHGWVVGGYVNNLWICLLNHDDLFRFDYLCLHLLLLSGF